ncbi:MAG: Cu(I)-responsive transcriptional regulator [Xanthomonadales bacterium]|nr:Cu(I)-responsive transcriptional regulator [Xanthomonadales bacterium]|tara:strand:+ start:1523 stop:1990 length:468 start_codon:yes stop_codon:yes gene_type:complete
MNIGQAAKASGVSAKMIRYYESISLIPEAARTAAGYRVYRDSEVHTLQFIRRARDLGFSLKSIAQLLALWQDRERASADVKAFALAHVDELYARIRELETMANTLQHLADHCRGNERPDCPILDDLARDPDSVAEKAVVDATRQRPSANDIRAVS